MSQIFEMKKAQQSSCSCNRDRALAIVSLAALIWMQSCSKGRKDPAPGEQPPEVATATATEEAELERAHPRVLGFTPAFELTDQNGGRFSSDLLAGKPWVANFMFTRCPTTCPRQTALLKTVQDRILGDRESGGLRLHIVSFTVDPANDTPAVLKSYAGQAGSDDQIWKFLTGSVEEIRGTISREGFKLAVKVDENNPASILHSPLFVLVDSYQRVRGLYDSESPKAISELMTDVAALEAEIVNVPADLQDPEWMKDRERSQLASAKSIRAFHDFTFSDQREASGIRFMHKIVDESGKRFKGVHYDHGSGIVVADVDGDERLDIYFVNQVGENELWRNLGGGKFENITERAGVFVSDRIGVSAAFADIDNDGDPDLFVTAVRKGNVLFENLGGGKFRNVTAGSGLAYKGHSSGVVFFDYDRDGLVDVLVTNVGKYTKEEVANVTMESIRGEADTGDKYPVGFDDAFGGHLKPERTEASRLYRNLGDKKFQDVGAAMGLDDIGWTGDAAPVDINSDGWTDLYMLNMQGDDQVFLNREGKKFERAGRDLFPKTPWGSMGIKAFDFENDGDLDIFITDMHSDMSEHIGSEKEKEKAAMQWTPSFLKTEGTSIFGNAFFRRADDGKFEEVSDQLGAENYWPWGLSADDLNADGFDDAFLTSSMNFPLRYGVNSLLLNDGGTRFRDSEFILGVEPRAGGLAVPWFELDLVGADKDAPVLETLKAEGADLEKLPDRIVVWGAMGSRSSAIFDLDDDGDLDIVTNEMNHHPMVLLSNLSEKKPDLAFLKVKLVGTKSNRSALGAVVRVEAGDLKLMKVKDGQSGYLSHSDFPLYFGLGTAKQIDRLEVSWPSGIVQVIEGPIDRNQMLTVEESE
ncbi:MAG: FG-GAP-like repeat-containing protein [Planctomycetota bacterium]|nr:FG-GAP-like repeat-containing protein [Planctomycetota bacterium]